MAKWISVEDALPDRDDPVIVCHHVTGRGVFTKHLEGDKVWFARYRNGWKRADGLSQDPIFYGNVTHWQPLPAPPKASK